jgi:hypothetical protein
MPQQKPALPSPRRVMPPQAMTLLSRSMTWNAQSVACSRRKRSKSLRSSAAKNVGTLLSKIDRQALASVGR